MQRSHRNGRYGKFYVTCILSQLKKKVIPRTEEAGSTNSPKIRYVPCNIWDTLILKNDLLFVCDPDLNVLHILFANSGNPTHKATLCI